MAEEIKRNRIGRLEPQGRWHVPVQDDGSWRMGVYKPECASPDSIDVLEKHTCPELFLCLHGKAGLLLKNEHGEETLVLSEGEYCLVDDYHNGFLHDPEGLFLVVERTSFTTEYIDRKTGGVIKTVTVGRG